MLCNKTVEILRILSRILYDDVLTTPSKQMMQSSYAMKGESYTRRLICYIKFFCLKEHLLYVSILIQCAEHLHPQSTGGSQGTTHIQEKRSISKQFIKAFSPCRRSIFHLHCFLIFILLCLLPILLLPPTHTHLYLWLCSVIDFSLITPKTSIYLIKHKKTITSFTKGQNKEISLQGLLYTASP